VHVFACRTVILDQDIDDLYACLDKEFYKFWTQFMRRYVLLLSLSTLVNAADSILVISIDSLHPDALSARTSPTLHALMQTGRHTLQGRSVDPPKTLIAHTAMLTGLPPARNGKIDNEWQPGEPQVSKPTLFDDAKQFGYRTAFYYSKPKRGYLVNAAVEVHGLEPVGAVLPARLRPTEIENLIPR
jgi:hypothetical protein